MFLKWRGSNNVQSSNAGERLVSPISAVEDGFTFCLGPSFRSPLAWSMWDFRSVSVIGALITTAGQVHLIKQSLVCLMVWAQPLGIAVWFLLIVRLRTQTIHQTVEGSFAFASAIWVSPLFG